jgi:hypothetical protein
VIHMLTIFQNKIFMLWQYKSIFQRSFYLVFSNVEKPEPYYFPIPEPVRQPHQHYSDPQLCFSLHNDLKFVYVRGNCKNLLFIDKIIVFFFLFNFPPPFLSHPSPLVKYPNGGGRSPLFLTKHGEKVLMSEIMSCSSAGQNNSLLLTTALMIFLLVLGDFKWNYK